MKDTTIAPSKAAAAKTMYEVFKILKEEGGQYPSKDIIKTVGDRLEFTDWEKAALEKTGNIRWQSILRFYSIDYMKTGYLLKSKGTWYLTPEGEAAFKKMSPIDLLKSASAGYRLWQKGNLKTNEKEELPEEVDTLGDVEKELQANLDQMEEQAITGIKDFITRKNPYEFQFLIAALLRAMGYYTPFVAPKGKDGGIDIIAYQDPLGIKTPRLKVQVKHYPQNPISAEPIRSLKGLINGSEEIGLFITSGRFSSDAQRFARESNVHIKLIDGEELISLWQQHYHAMNDEDKNLLPLHPIYFLGSNE